MIKVLAGLFIKNNSDYKDVKVREAYGVLCGAVGIALNLLLFAVKFFAGTVSKSIAITADAFNNLSDAGSSVVTMIGFKLAGQKPDLEHPFGHGRMEYLSGLAVSILILLMGVELLKTSVQKIITPQIPENSVVVVVILVLSVVIKLYMGVYNRVYAKKIESAAMDATSKDSFSDSVSTGVVLLAIIVGSIFGIAIDGWCGLIVALLIIKTGVDSVKDTVGPLLGQPADEEFVDKISSIVKEHSIVLGIHDLVVHDYGPGRLMISLHAEVPYKEDIMVIHDEIDIIEAELRMKLNCEAVIHMDPVVTDDEEVNATKKKVEEIINAFDPILHFHDFRMVKGLTHTNLIFDIVAPFKYKLSDDELKKTIATKIYEYNNQLFSVIMVDHDYVKHN